MPAIKYYQSAGKKNIFCRFYTSSHEMDVKKQETAITV